MPRFFTGQRSLLRDQSRQRGRGSCSSQDESCEELHCGDKAAANLILTREQSDRDKGITIKLLRYVEDNF